MRVLHLITRLILGGAQENTLLTVMDLADRHGDEVVLATGPAEGPEGDLFGRAAKEGVRVELLPSLRRAISPWDDAQAYRAIVGLIKKYRPEVIHTHSSKAGILGRVAGWRARVPAVIHTIHGLPFHPYQRPLVRSLYVAAERMGARRCHKIISVADAMTEQALAAGIGRPGQFVTIKSGMEVEPFLSPARGRAEVRRELGIGEEEIVVMKVARLFELKGHDDIIDAAKRMKVAEKRIRFVFVGGGTWRERLEAKIRSYGLGDRFLLTGLVSPARIPELLGAADMVAHASYREGLARVLPQALLAGRPVISYDVDGAREVVLPGQTGILVRPGDIEGLARAMEVLAADDERRRRFGATGRAHFTEPFRHEVMTAAIRQVYLEVLGRS